VGSPVLEVLAGHTVLVVGQVARIDLLEEVLDSVADQLGFAELEEVIRVFCTLLLYQRCISSSM